jgi:ABC-type nitrate/sulfonate/bicarbonate transport system substrate-binding protein
MTPPNSLSVVAFVGPETLPLHVAAEHGYYAREGLNVRWEAATGSIDQMVRLIGGDCDMVMTAIDNIIAYNAGQRGVPVDPLPDLVAFLGCASEPRPLIGLPEFSGLADLRGRRIAVDALNTGFSFLLRQLLKDAGLGMTDYELVPVGAPPARWQSMQAGDCAAALLSKAFAAIAIGAGCHELRAEHDPWASYQGGVFAARRSWIADHANDVAAFIRATLAATGWILDTANRAQLPDLLMAHLPHMTDEASIEAADNMSALLARDLPINMAGLNSVIALRQKYGTPPAALGDPDAYLDLSLYERVMGAR